MKKRKSPVVTALTLNTQTRRRNGYQLKASDDLTRSSCQECAYRRYVQVEKQEAETP